MQTLLKPFFCLFFALSCGGAAYSQWSVDDSDQHRKVVLDEFILNDKGLKRYTNKLASEDGRWYFRPGDELQLATADSTFNLLTIPILSSKRIRLREIRLKLGRWDTSRMRLNLMVMQLHNGDTNFVVRRLPMEVRKNWLRLRIDDLGFELASDAFFVGISIAALHVPAPFTYRFFAAWFEDAHLIIVKNGRVMMPPKLVPFAIPMEIGFDEY